MNAILHSNLTATAERIKRLSDRVAIDMWAIGKELIEARANLDAEHTFTEWVENECELKRSQAYRFIAVAEAFPERPNLGRMSAAAVFEISAPSTPPEVRQEIIERAAAGEVITAEEARRIKAEAKSARDNLAASEAHRRSLQDRVSDLTEENERLQEPRTITVLPNNVALDQQYQAFVAHWRSLPMELRERFWGEFKTAFSAPDSSSCVASNPLEPGALHDATDGEGHTENAGGNGTGRHAIGETDRPEHPEIHHELGDMAAEAPATNGGGGHHNGSAAAGNGGVEAEIPLSLIRDPALRESERERRVG